MNVELIQTRPNGELLPHQICAPRGIIWAWPSSTSMGCPIRAASFRCRHHLILQCLPPDHHAHLHYLTRPGRLFLLPSPSSRHQSANVACPTPSPSPISPPSLSDPLCVARRNPVLTKSGNSTRRITTTTFGKISGAEFSSTSTFSSSPSYTPPKTGGQHGDRLSRRSKQARTSRGILL